MELDKQYLGWNLYLVGEKYKNRVMIDKNFRNKEKIGTIKINLNTHITDADLDNTMDEDFDDVEQVFTKKTNCKYQLIYGLQDFQHDLKIFKLNNLKSSILIEIPNFKNYLIYNILSVKLLNELIPSKISLIVEDTENTSKVSKINEKSEIFKTELVNGSYVGGGGERGLDGINGAILNRTLVNPQIATDVDFYCISAPSKGTLYL